MNIGVERRGGFECGTSAAKLVLLKRGKAGTCIDNISIEEAAFEARGRAKNGFSLELSRKLIIRNNLSRFKVVMTGTGMVECCFVLLPKMKEADLEGARLLQAKKLLSWEHADPQISYVDSEFLHNRVGSVVALAQWNELKPWCKLIEGSEGSVDDVTTSSCAYMALSQSQGWGSKHRVFMVADFGASSSSFHVFDRNSVRFIRKVPSGGDAITKALTTEVSTSKGAIRLSDSEAEDLKISRSPRHGRSRMAAMPPVQLLKGIADSGDESDDPDSDKMSRHVEVTVRPVVEKIVSEVARSMQFFAENTGLRVEAVFITGGTAAFPLLRNRLQSSLSVPVNIIDPFAGMTFATEELKAEAEMHKMSMAVAVGLALAERSCVSLLSKNVQLAKQVARFAPAAAVLLLLLGFFPMIAGGIFKTILIQKARLEARAHSEELASMRNNLGDKDALQATVLKSHDYLNDLKMVMANSPLWAGVLNSLAESVPTEVTITHLATDSSKPDRTGLILRGQVSPAASGFDNAVASVLSALNSSPFFCQVKVASGEASRTAESLGTFEIRCEIVY